MNCLDFLSESPKLFIFQKKTNKTNFGGILFLIYIIIMLFISTTYIIDYITNDKYSYEALTFYNHTDDAKEKEKINKNIELNPFLNLSFYFYQPEEKFAVYDLNNKKFLEKDSIDKYGNIIYNIQKQVSDINITIYFKCEEDDKCPSMKEFFELYDYTIFVGVDINYASYKINHFDNIPVKKYEDKPENFFDAHYSENTELEIWNFDWEVIKYKDQRSLLDLITKDRKEYNFGRIKNKKPERIYKDNNSIEHIRGEGYYYPLFEIHFFNNHDEYLLYKRKKVELLDVLANIGALFSTIKFFFALFFSFYSDNFNNYKLIDKIMSHAKDLNEDNKLNKDKNTSANKKEENNNYLNKKNNLDALIDEKLSDDNIIGKYSSINNIDIEEDNNKIKDEDSFFILKKLSFLDFLFNNIYSKCCNINNQEIIENINSIVYQYLSVDSLLYNQIKLENLFKDYKWNNPLLSNIKNNKTICDLKQL